MDEEKENEIKHWQYAYDKAFTFHQINIDTYFKRTQILMLAIQGALLATLIKFLTIDESINGSTLYQYKFALLTIISILGIVFCFMWISMIQRQWYTLEHLRCHMRYIERHLMKLDVPLAIFRSESIMSYHQGCVFFGDDEQCKKRENDRCQSCQRKYPYGGKKKKIGLMKLEEQIVYIIRVVWLLCFSIFLYQTLKNSDIIIVECFIYSCFFVIIAILSIYMILILAKSSKDEKKSCMTWIGFSGFLLLSISLFWIMDYLINTLEFLLSVCVIASVIYTILEWTEKDKAYRNKQSFLFWELRDDFECSQRHFR